jgi:hypothetical protein
VGKPKIKSGNKIMKVLVLNSGSSSIKYQFIDTDTKDSASKRIG